MSIIGELYKPDIACLPVGDLFTMGSREAAYACRLLGVKKGSIHAPQHFLRLDRDANAISPCTENN